jgi:hypothetical protein
VSLAWSSSRLEQATILSTHGRPCRIRGDVSVSAADSDVAIEQRDDGVTFATRAGTTYLVTPR